MEADLPFQRALAGGVPHRIGSFCFYFDDERWEWSDTVQEMHGYPVGTMSHPDTAVVLSHKHPDDLRQVTATLERAIRNRNAFCTRHRIVDVAGGEHSVLVVADQLLDEAGVVVGTQGFYVDLGIDGLTTNRAVQEQVSAVVAEIAERRSVIEHAKGMLMMVYDVDEAAAFDLLRWRSQMCNVKVRVFAEQLVSEFRALGGDELAPRSRYDKALMSAHKQLPRP